ncbi:MAG: hypothetical protein A2297_00305 [Elusimicrobia bacterium RIFOXYB2_FULL_48_7]|nr:MAG: hypothetical protein A2297_00305 [Elusimicrobia bacterium RIFOXYB2_FULL_48_7]
MAILLTIYHGGLTDLFGASYYVQNGGNDNAAGTIAAPWAHCPGMHEWTGSQALSPGDTVYFINSGTWAGTYNKYVLNVATGGITYDGCTWGSGPVGSMAKIYSSIKMLSEMGIVTINVDHPTIPTVVKGFEINGSTGDTNGIRFMPGNYTQQNLTGAVKRVENCAVYDAGISTTNWSYGICVTSIENGEHKTGTTLSNVEILNCKVARASRSGIVVYPSSGNTDDKCTNIVIRGCEVWGCGTSTTSIAAGIGLKNWTSNVLVEYNYSHDNIGLSASFPTGLGFFMDGVWECDGSYQATVRYNIFTGNGSDGTRFSNVGPRDVYFYGNIVASNGGAGISIRPNNGGLSTKDFKMKIYNNTFYKNCRESVWNDGEAALNRTIWTASVLEFTNNIVYADSTGTGPRICLYDEISPARVTAHSNNIYYRAGGGNLVRNGTPYYTSANLSSWESSAYSTLPAFKNTTNVPSGFIGTYGVNLIPNADGLSVETGTAINNGANIGSSYNGAINLSGKSGALTRPQGGGWDIGAYEYTMIGVDTSPPTNIATVNDGTGADESATTLTTQLSANWTSSADAESGVAAYKYAIGTSPSSTNTSGWATIGNVLTITKTGLSLTVGTTYYFSVKAVNGSTLESNATNSNGVVVLDITPPVMASVRDGTGADIVSTMANDRLSANWDEASDPESGVSGYLYAIGTTPGGTNVAAWTSLGSNYFSITRSSLTLSPGSTYYFSVKAVNSSNLASLPVNSNGQYVIAIDTGDITPPTAPAVVRDGSGADISFTYSSTTLTANWAASSDPESGIARYWIAIGTIPGSGNIKTWFDNGQMTSFNMNSFSLTANLTYYISIKAENNVGLQSLSATTSDGQVVLIQAPIDTTPPVISLVLAQNITQTAAVITWTTDEPATSLVEYGSSANYNKTTTLDSSLATTHSMAITNLVATSVYHYRVISRDTFGNETASVDYTFTTLPPATPINAEIHAYPNPYRISNNGVVKFRVTGASSLEVNIYTISGRLVKKLKEIPGAAETTWDVTNTEGEKVGRGIYIYKITCGSGESVTGKLAAIK